MTEQRPTKASKVVDRLMSRKLSPREIAERYPQAPELRLRADAPAVEIDETTPVVDVLERLGNSDIGALALRPRGADPTAVVVPIERYLELVGKELLHSRGKVVGASNDFRPPDAALETVSVELVDPAAVWPLAH